MSGQFDIVVFGATGFTGELAARHLITEPESALGSPNAIKWALAARSASKLAALKEELVNKVPDVDSKLIDAILTLVADSHNEVSLLNMVKQTKVVLSLVGPYTLHGETLVKLCAENGVHYCDLTGEMLWVRDMIRKYQDVCHNFSGAHCSSSAKMRFGSTYRGLQVVEVVCSVVEPLAQFVEVVENHTSYLAKVAN